MMVKLRNPRRTAWISGAAIALLLAATGLGAAMEPVWLQPTGPDGAGYGPEVEALVSAWEAERGEPLRPGETGRVALKVYTNSGPGLCTPPELVRALARVLGDRGFARDDIIVVDLSERRLRECGFLPPLSEGGTRFDGMPVIAIEAPGQTDAGWFYESALPPDPTRTPGILPGDLDPGAGDTDRKSFLPLALLFDLDLWINLPVLTDHRVLGVNGALVNGSLWAVTNQQRFFQQRVNAAAAAAEIAAIPELAGSYAFSLLSLETFQFVGGPRFNAAYCGEKPFLLLSRDPLILDRLGLGWINEARLETGFAPISPEPLIFRYGTELGLGSPEGLERRLRELPPVRAP